MDAEDVGAFLALAGIAVILGTGLYMTFAELGMLPGLFVAGGVLLLIGMVLNAP